MRVVATGIAMLVGGFSLIALGIGVMIMIAIVTA